MSNLWNKSEKYGDFWHKMTFYWFYLSTDDPISGGKGLIGTTGFKP